MSASEPKFRIGQMVMTRSPVAPQDNSDCTMIVTRDYHVVPRLNFEGWVYQVDAQRNWMDWYVESSIRELPPPTESVTRAATKEREH